MNVEHLAAGHVEILLVEDNPGDVRLIREAFSRVETLCNLHVAQDGIEALAFLNREGRHASAVRPGLILLDLNLPRKDGREVLAQIKGDESLRRIPVVILSGSDDRQDIFLSYDLHGNCYITKPFDLDEFIRVARSIQEFWLNTVRLPEE